MTICNRKYSHNCQSSRFIRGRSLNIEKSHVSPHTQRYCGIWLTPFLTLNFFKQSWLERWIFWICGGINYTDEFDIDCILKDDFLHSFDSCEPETIFSLLSLISLLDRILQDLYFQNVGDSPPSPLSHIPDLQWLLSSKYLRRQMIKLLTSFLGTQNSDSLSLSASQMGRVGHRCPRLHRQRRRAGGLRHLPGAHHQGLRQQGLHSQHGPPAPGLGGGHRYLPPDPAAVHVGTFHMLMSPPSHHCRLEVSGVVIGMCLGVLVNFLLIVGVNKWKRWKLRGLLLMSSSHRPVPGGICCTGSSSTSFSPSSSLSSRSSSSVWRPAWGNSSASYQSSLPSASSTAGQR